VTVSSKDGREIIKYKTDTPIDGNAAFKPATRPVKDSEIPSSAEQAYLKGLTFARKSQEKELRAAFAEALKRDPNFSPAQVELGLSYYRSGEYNTAAGHLEKALLRDPASSDARYYLSLVRRAQGRVDEAIEQLNWLVRRGEKESVARYVLGETALTEGRAGEAVEHFSEALRLEPRDLKARAALALAERIAGRYDAAQQNIDAVLWQMPIDYLALSEKHEIAKARGKDDQAKQARQEFWRVLSREPDSVLTVAFDYAALGRKAEARGVLEEAAGRKWTSPDGAQKTYPMIHYSLGFLYEQNGDAKRAAEHYALGSQGDTAYVFPHRVEEIEVLRAAFKANPRDGRAAYYLGNVLASKLRSNEALVAWQDAVRLDQTNVFARRNLARALWVVADKKQEAAREYESTIAASPNDYRLYIEYDKLLEASGAKAQRLRILENAPAAVQQQSSFAQTLADAYVDQGEFEKAAAILDKHTFTTGEGEISALSIYRRAHLGLANKYRLAGDSQKAAAAFLKATQYPKNLGVGRPAMESQAREYVFAARELEKAGKAVEAKTWWQRAALDPLNSPVQPEEPWSEHYYYKAVALEQINRKDEARALYERLARLADERLMLESEPVPPTGAIRFVLAGAGLKAIGRQTEARTMLERALSLNPQSELAREQLADLQKKGSPKNAASRRVKTDE
jgi:tetratricopeptide (TPR) repeat protein